MELDITGSDRLRIITFDAGNVLELAHRLLQQHRELTVYRSGVHADQLEHGGHAILG